MHESAMIRFKEDEIILRQGSTDREMYKILSGKVAIYFNFGEPDEYLLGILSEQRCFGEISILCDKPNIYTVVAYEEVLALRITEDSFGAFIKNNPQNAIDIMKNLANTITTMNMNLSLLTQELTEMIATKPDPQKLKDITHRIRQYAALESMSKTFYSVQV